MYPSHNGSQHVSGIKGLHEIFDTIFYPDNSADWRTHRAQSAQCIIHTTTQMKLPTQSPHCIFLKLDFVEFVEFNGFSYQNT